MRNLLDKPVACAVRIGKSGHPAALLPPAAADEGLVPTRNTDFGVRVDPSLSREIAADLPSSA